MTQSIRDEKLNLINEIMDYVLGEPYDAEKCAQYVYVKFLDEKTYRYGDNELNSLLDNLRGMSAGEEFYYSKEEVIEMLCTYVSALK